MKKIEQKFNISNYKKLLEYIKCSNLNFKNFGSNLKKGRNIIMRHDIDFCPERALEIALIEKEASVFSTFFFLVNTEFYNLNSFINKAILKEIISLGHYIGLHFDASFYSQKSRLGLACKKELHTLEQIILKKIHIVSFHRPSRAMLNMNNKLAGLEHTYMKKFIKDIVYCSDSQGKWRYKNPKEIIDENLKNPKFNLHLLTHPIWWTTPLNKNSAEKVDFHLKKKYSNLKNVAAINCKPYSKYLKNFKKI